jgi:hypothetical protein
LSFTPAEHLGKARQNEEFAHSLNPLSLCSLEWAVTANFYAALHYVQAYFAAQAITFKMHTNRATAIARDARIKTVYPDYREMQDASEAARYEVNAIKLEDLARAQTCLARVKDAIQRAEPRIIE